MRSRLGLERGGAVNFAQRATDFSRKACLPVMVHPRHSLAARRADEAFVGPPGQAINIDWQPAGKPAG